MALQLLQVVEVEGFLAGAMSESYARDSERQSSDQASPASCAALPRFAHDAHAGFAFARAQRGYAIPGPPLSQSSPVIFPGQSPQQQQQQQYNHSNDHHHHHDQPASDPLAHYLTLDAYAHTAWDWSQLPNNLTELPTAYEAQGELVHGGRDGHPLLVVDPLAPPPRPPPPPMKRRADAHWEPESVQGVQSVQSAGDAGNSAKRRAMSRTSSTTSRSPAPAAPADTTKGTGPLGKETDVSSPRRVVEAASPSSAALLPAGRVFPIQIGSALFRLSGASLCSDGESPRLVCPVWSAPSCLPAR